MSFLLDIVPVGVAKTKPAKSASIKSSLVIPIIFLNTDGSTGNIFALTSFNYVLTVQPEFFGLKWLNAITIMIIILN